jgi:tetraacyldisaccharide 4'-kinase
MMVGPDRKAAIEALLAEHAIDVIISDDGLQHLALQRDIEICIIDDTSPQENEHLLPAGPYREPLNRLMSVDFIVRHGGDVGNADNQFSMSLQADEPLPLRSQSGAGFPLEKPIHAIAGIGNPQRFFDTCESQNYHFEAHRFADHHHFTQSDIDFGDSTVLMTEKDAVKCLDFADERHWYLPVNAKLSEGLIEAVMAKLNKNFRLQRVSEIDATNSD